MTNKLNGSKLQGYLEYGFEHNLMIAKNCFNMVMKLVILNNLI